MVTSILYVLNVRVVGWLVGRTMELYETEGTPEFKYSLLLEDNSNNCRGIAQNEINSTVCVI